MCIIQECDGWDFLKALYFLYILNYYTQRRLTLTCLYSIPLKIFLFIPVSCCKRNVISISFELCLIYRFILTCPG